jgi:ABC-2 type transport system ATP-binding protein
LAALLGDPPVLLCDEPVNGLDPEGIVWIRTLLRRLAGEGRTVLVSSHLMSEMALTADELIVVGKGRLVAATTTQEFIDRASTRSVLVRTSTPAALGHLLLNAGGSVAHGQDGALVVTGADASAVGGLAADHGIRLQELSTQRASLEAAFIELTRDSLEFQPSEVS